MDIALRIFIIAISVFIFFNVIFMLIKRRLDESNSILWLFVSVVILLVGIFPGIIDRAAMLIGIDYQPALLFLVAIIVLFMIVFSCSMAISRMKSEISELAIILSLLKEEIRHLREENDSEDAGE